MPVPEEGRAAPLLGSFLADRNGGVDELCGPSIRRGLGQTCCRAGRREYAYDGNLASQFQNERADSELRRLHFCLTDSFIHMSNRFYGEIREKQGRPLEDWPIGEACRDFCGYLTSEQDFAPESLIVEIARRCTAAVDSIMKAPRAVLHRRHADVPIDRLQELDEYSLRALAGRPGKRIADKAGHKQRLTGIMREETPDTHENRVVVDFVVRSQRIAEQYCRTMCGRCRRRGECATRNPRIEGEKCASARVRCVADYHARCGQWLVSGNAKEIRRMAQPAMRANYVLEQNPRYVTVWRTYLRMLRQEDIEEDVWKWMRRSWTDYVRLTLMIAWEERLQGRSAVRLSRRALKLKSRNERGRWLGRDPFEEALVLETRGGGYRTIYLLDGEEAEELAGVRFADLLNADAYCVRVEEDGAATVMPVWGVVGAGEWRKAGETFRDALRKEIRATCEAVAAERFGAGTKARLGGGVVATPRVSGENRFDGVLWELDAANPDFEIAAGIITGEAR